MRMTPTLAVAFAEVAKLPLDEQEALAAWLLAELAAERRWNDLFQRSPDTLSTLADEAVAEWQAGRTQPLDPDHL